MAEKKDYLPALAMVSVQAGYAGMNVLSKLALDAGMSPYVLITYRQIFATVALAPIAFFFERKTRLKMTARLVFQILISSTFGATLNQLLYLVGLKYTSSTVACALTNILPAMTFIMAVPFRIESAEMRSGAGKAKVVGTAICVGGSMLMTFYKGPLIRLPASGIHWRYAEEVVSGASGAGADPSAGSSNEIIGAALVVASCAAWAAWFIMQAKMSKSFSAPYTSSTLMCAIAAIECLAVGAAIDRRWASWALTANIRLAASLYIGLIGSAFTVSLTMWAIEKRGPLFASMFNPLLLVIVAVLGWAILDEKLYTGSALGSVIIILGLYLVLWGKGKEIDPQGNNGGSTKGSLPIHSANVSANCEKKEAKIQEN